MYVLRNKQIELNWIIYFSPDIVNDGVAVVLKTNIPITFKNIPITLKNVTIILRNIPITLKNIPM